MTEFLSASIDYINPSRQFSLSYVIVDSLFLIFFASFLLYQKKRMTFLFSLAGGILYFLVDFLIFYLWTKSRVITYNGEVCSPLGTAGVLFWMSMSYGFLDFAFIWLWLSKDKHALEYSIMIAIWWMCCPLISQFLTEMIPNMPVIFTTRSTGRYHGIMGLIMVVGYFIIIIMNIKNKDAKEKQIPIIRLFIIGFMAQFLWEFLLFVFGVRYRYENNDFVDVLNTVLRDSFVETNLGMPYLYFIHRAITKNVNEDLSLTNLKQTD